MAAVSPPIASPSIGVAGVGRMGSAIAHRLLEVGQSVVVWNRTRSKADELAEVGALIADTPADLASMTDVVLSILSDSTAVEATYLHQDGLLAGSIAGQLFVEMSTVRPATVQGLSVEVRKRGAALIDCPVAGSVGPALEGKLFGFVGGELEDVTRARTVLAYLCRRLEHLGPVGSGSRMKLAIQLPVHVYWQTLGEALVLCRSLGVDPDLLVDIFGDTPGASNVIKERAGAIASALRGEANLREGATRPAAFDIDAIRKDLRTMILEAESLGFDSPLASASLKGFDLASVEGFGHLSAAAFTKFWIDRSPTLDPSGRDQGQKQV